MLYKEDNSDFIALLQKQVRDLQETNYYQALAIENLKNENIQLKQKLEEKVLLEKNLNKSRPQSCLRNSSSSPKKARVAFAKDLIKVKYITNGIDECHKQSQFIEKNNCENNIVEKKEMHHRASRSEYETPPKFGYEEYSIKDYLQEKRTQMSKLNSMSIDNSFPSYFRDRSMKIAKKLIKD